MKSRVSFRRKDRDAIFAPEEGGKVDFSGMDVQTLSLHEWEALAQTEQEQIARDILQRLPVGWAFRRIYQYTLGAQHHAVAMFTWKLSAFSFIPGGIITLGYDPTCALPLQEQQRDWNEETLDYFVNEPFDAFLSHQLSPLRHVAIKPFLLQAIPQQLGPPFSGTYTSGDSVITYEGVQSIVQEEGFRLPTSDEWEYACAAGARTLFRWGNDCPLDGDPISISTWQVHRSPNAFGLLMSSNPYNWEYCQEPGIRRGGDGGQAAHAGAGIFASWLPLASAFQSHWSGDHDRVHLRRALSLEAH